jgi:hypothetical protein
MQDIISAFVIQIYITLNSKQKWNVLGFKQMTNYEIWKILWAKSKFN